jgi:hypothetical protein
MVTSRKVGRVRMCQLLPDTLAAAQGWIEKERRVWEARLNQLDSLVEILAAAEITHEQE